MLAIIMIGCLLCQDPAPHTARRLLGAAMPLVEAHLEHTTTRHVRSQTIRADTPLYTPPYTHRPSHRRQLQWSVWATWDLARVYRALITREGAP